MISRDQSSDFPILRNIKRLTFLRVREYNQIDPNSINVNNIHALWYVHFPNDPNRTNPSSSQS